jgi:hypothetical protein
VPLTLPLLQLANLLPRLPLSLPLMNPCLAAGEPAGEPAAGACWSSSQASSEFVGCGDSTMPYFH